MQMQESLLVVYTEISNLIFLIARFSVSTSIKIGIIYIHTGHCS